MTDTVAERFRRSEIAELLARYPGLRLLPPASMAVRVEGTLRFCASAKITESIEDSYDVRIEVPQGFPERMALVWELGRRIPPNYHRLDNGALCLGSRVRLWLQMGGSPSLLRFVERCVIPYLYGYSYFAKYGVLPFGELKHGERGTLQDLASLLGVHDPRLALAICDLAGTKKRRANRRPCPCESGRRLGRCHNRRVNALRKRIGRKFLASEMGMIELAIHEHSHGKSLAVIRDEAARTRSILLKMIQQRRAQAVLPASFRPEVYVHLW